MTIRINTFERLTISKTLIRITSLMFSTFFLWKIFIDTHSIIEDGLIPAFSLVGYLIISLPGGIILDKFRRSRVFFFVSIVPVFAYLFLFYSSDLIVLYIVDVIISMISGFTSDIINTIMKDFVAEENIGKASSLLIGTRALSDLLGLLAGGLGLLIGMNIFLSLIVGLSIVSIPLSLPVKGENRPTKSEKSISKIGRIIYILMPVLLLALIVNGFFVCIDVFAAALVESVMHGSVIEYTIFLLGFPVGMITGSLISSKHHDKFSKGGIMVIELVLMGSLLILLGLDKNPLIPFFITFPMGLASAFLNISLQTLFIKIIPSNLLGRIGSLTNFLAIGSSPVMALFWTALSSKVYFPLIFVYSGIAISITSVIFLPALIKLVNEYGSKPEPNNTSKLQVMQDDELLP